MKALQFKFLKDPKVNKLRVHFIIRSTQCNSVKKNKIKRIVKEYFKKVDSPLVGTILIGLKSAKYATTLKNIPQEIRSDLEEWHAKNS